jgi:hypothetical protein
MKKSLKAIFVLAGCLVITGCNSGTVPDSTLPSAQPDALVEAVGDLVDEFRMIADASCEMAREIGVTERAEGTTLRLVFVPEAYSYNDFFAAVVSDSGGQEPIWTTEDFMSCVDSINFILAEEGGSEYEISVSGNLADGLIRSVYEVEDYGQIVSDYVVRNGVFVEAVVASPESTSKIYIEYGTPSDDDIASFREAIDMWIAGN